MSEVVSRVPAVHVASTIVFLISLISDCDNDPTAGTETPS